MLFRTCALAIVLTLASSPTAALAGAKITFSQYEGVPIIETGQGGTRVQQNGIDYWTTGAPPRRYQVIGVIQDKRDEDWDGGHAVGSRTVAKRVKAAGGDAVVIQSQEEAGGGAGAGGGGVWGGIFAMGGSKTITNMLVVKYLPDEPPAQGNAGSETQSAPSEIKSDTP
jgi:hypothetical protein